MREEIKWIYYLALKMNKPLGFWLAPSNMKIGVKSMTINTSKLYEFVVENNIIFDPNGGKVTYYERKKDYPRA